MSVRYTAVTSMPEAAPREFDRDLERERDIDRWRDKLELRLDNRQVFFLFFGSAVVACMLFILGVMVGKRIESRGQAEAATPQDPLAALDRAHEPATGTTATTTEPELSFPNTLIAGASTATKGGKSPSSKVKPIALASAPKLAPAGPPKPIAAPPAAAVPKAAAPVAAPKIVASVATPKVIIGAPKPIIAGPAAKAPTPIASAKPVPLKSAGPSADPVKVKGKFTLQLSTFTTADEAKAFADRFPGAFIIAGDATGKGGAFRVRYGNFASYKEATDAKESFEKQHNMIALVAAR